MKDCEEGTTFNDYCYKIIKQSNWFDAIDQCKSHGGSLVALNSQEKTKFLSGNFANVSSFWLHDLGLFSYGSVVWSNGSHSNVSRNMIFEKKNYTFANVSGNVTHYGNSTPNETLEMDGDMFGNGSDTPDNNVHLEESFWCPVFNKEHILGMNCSSLVVGVCEMPGKRRGVRKEVLRKVNVG